VTGVEAQVEYCPGAPPDENNEGAHYEDAEEAVEHVEGRFPGPLHNKATRN